MKKLLSPLAVVIALLFPLLAVHATENKAVNDYVIVIKDHKFSPETLTVPANQKVKLVIDNQDATPEEFESHTLHREKIIRGNSKAIIYIGPLTQGSYSYVGEFNEDTAKGTIVAQ